MSTRSIMALQTEPGADDYRSIYVHCDGHPDTRLPLLKGYYVKPDKAQALFDLGDCSSVSELLPEEVPGIHAHGLSWMPDGKDSFDDIRWDVTTPYSMRGDISPATENLTHKKVMRGDREEWLYVGQYNKAGNKITWKKYKG